MVRSFAITSICALFFVGCTTKAQLTYHPVIPTQKAKNIGLKVESFDDQRQRKLAVGAIRNLYGMPIITIKTDSNVPDWISTAFKAELTNAGYDMIEDNSQYVIEGKILNVFSNAHFMYQGNLLVEIALKKDRAIVFEKQYETNKNRGINWIASPTQCMNALENNLQEVCKQFINDLNEKLSPTE